MNTAIKLPPKELTINATSLSALAKEYNLQLKGPDREINMMGYLDDESEFLDGMLSYALGIEYVEDVKNRGIAAVIVPESLASEIPAGFSALLTRDNPDDKFHSIFVDFIAKDKWQKVDKYIGERVKIAPSVVIMDPVYIGDDCEIDPNTVLYPNTVLEKQVHIGANSNISPIGFEIKHFGGKRRLIPHNGGVWIEENVEIGCSVTVDSNMFGKFTRIGKDTKVANQVQIAHGAQIGRSCMIQGSSQIANCHMGD